MKQCSKCKQTLPIELFNAKGTLKDGSLKYQTYCRECNKIRSRQYYADNRESHKKETVRRKKESRLRSIEYVANYLKDHPCVDCGENNILCLEFDHQRDKVACVSKLISGGFGIEKIKEEIDKCEVRCANCHRIKTAYDFNWKMINFI